MALPLGEFDIYANFLNQIKAPAVYSTFFGPSLVKFGFGKGCDRRAHFITPPYVRQVPDVLPVAI